ncbi:antA/AntB antirepressor family protein [Psychrobacter pocilloporae]|uniref:antA/AntB antirepressor family protein n=1 Tax=Psychrobacter pocilloporae TaxID=1775882 RepID=UPI003C2E5899
MNISNQVIHNQTTDNGDYAMQLPTIQENKDLQQAVSARDLYGFLQPSERFGNWFERQLQYGFVENVDYVGCEVFNALARQSLQDYFLSIDMSKEISMIQRSDKGKQARQYFIDCERRANKQPRHQLPQSFAEALQLAANQALQIEQDAPKVAHYDKVVDRHSLLTATQVGQKIGLSAIMLNRVLVEIGVYNKAHKRGKAFKQWFIDKGLGEMKQTDMGYSQPLFSLKGEAWVIEHLASEGVA